MSFGDRKDGRLVRELDGMHFIVPLIYPNRCDNEAFISVTIDLTKVDEFLKVKNADDPEYKYNIFQFIVTSVLKMLYLRPKMNYFIANKNVYERYEKTCSFVVKKKFADNGGEGLAMLKAKPEYTIDDIHNKIKDIVYKQRSSDQSKDVDGSSYYMDILAHKIPRPISKAFVAFLRFLDRHGWCPSALISSDPYYTSVVLTNLGSIKLNSGYHHLTNWGTNSVFVAIGQMKKRPFYDDDGNMTMKNSIDLGFTIDERLADGYYYSRSIALIRKIFENPEILNEFLNKEIDY